MRHVYECPVRWADLDALGHVNNVVYVDYLQEARVDMFRSHRVELMGQELVEGLVVARTQVRYVEPLMFRFEPVRIDCWVTEGLEVGHYPVQVRFSDVDVYGHVNNVKYFEYLQEARIAMMGRLWEEVPGETGRSSLVVAQVDVDYKVPILHRAAPYDAWTWVSHVGSTSLVMETEIVDAADPEREVLLARARVVLVFFDPASGRPRRPDDDVRAPLLEVMSPSC